MGTQQPKLKDDEYIRLIAEVCADMVSRGRLNYTERTRILDAFILNRAEDIKAAKFINWSFGISFFK